MEYTAIDISTNGAYLVVGGKCSDSVVCTGTNLPNPFVEMIDTATRLHSWFYEITGPPDYDYVANIQFNYAGTKIVAALNFDNSRNLMFMIFDSNGNIERSL
jgi:hypothetical protein